MNNKPKVSVLMSVHNGEAYLQEAIDSILSQSFSDFEFIIINDASTDKTEDILRSITDTRLIILKNDTSLGLTKSLNIGLNKAKGEYIARMDADDVSVKERLELQVKFLDTHKDIVCVGGGTTIINEQGKVIGYKKPITDPELVHFYLMIKNQITHPAVCFRKDIIIKNGLYDESYTYTQDYALWSKLLLNGHKISNIDKPVLNYRLHSASITQGSSKEASYKLAQKTTQKNLSHYIVFSDSDFNLFTQSFHQHKVSSFRDLTCIISLLRKFEKKYLETEKPSLKNKKIISHYLKRERRNAVRWFLKCRFYNTYKLLAEIKHKIFK